jgi:hypothetical protein
MATAPNNALNERALQQFFNRVLATGKPKFIEPDFPFDMPRLEITVAVADAGGKTGVAALLNTSIAENGFVQIDVPIDGKLLPCVVAAFGPIGEDTCTIELRVIGSPHD